MIRILLLRQYEPSLKCCGTTLFRCISSTTRMFFSSFLEVDQHDRRFQSPWEYLLRFSENIRASADLMLALVKKCGLCFQYVAESLRKDNGEIIRAALQNDTRSMSFCIPGSTLDVILNDKAFICRLLKGCDQGWDAGTVCSDSCTRRFRGCYRTTRTLRLAFLVAGISRLMSFLPE